MNAAWLGAPRTVSMTATVSRASYDSCNNAAMGV